MVDGQDNAIDSPTATGELFMLRLRYKEARLIHAASNSPIRLAGRQTAWIVYTGRVDVFMVPIDAAHDAVAGTRRHLFRVQAGQAVFGLDPDMDGSPIALLAVGDPGTQLLQVKRSTLETLAQDASFIDPVVALLDGWVAGLSQSMAREPLPQEVTLLEPKGELCLIEGQVAHPGRNILWVKHLEGGSCFMGIPALFSPGDGFLPLSNRTWLQSLNASRLCVVDTRALVGQGLAWSSLDRFHQLALMCMQRTATQIEQDEHIRWQRRVAADRRQVDSAMSHLAATLQPEATRSFGSTPFGDEGESADAGAGPLWAACRWVGQAIGVTMQPSRTLAGRVPHDPIRDIARASRVRVRQVMLRGEWWRQANGPLLGYLTAPLASPSTPSQLSADAQAGRPVALLPTSGRQRSAAGCYELLDPVAQTRTRVTAQVAALLSSLAYVFYRPLPDRAITGLDLFKLGLRGNRSDVVAVMLAGLAMGGLAMIIPLMTGILFDAVIPSVQLDQLLQLSLALLVSALAAAMFQLTRNIAILRVGSRLTAWAQAATWDRLLRLPVPFFRQYAAGDLAERVLGINAISQIVSGTVISSLLSCLFSIFSLGLLFYYAPGLAWGAIGMALVFGLVVAAAGYWQLRFARTLHRLQVQIAGLVLQFVTGIAKFRTAGSEGRAFARWAKAFSRQKQVAFKSRMAANGLQTVYSVYPVLTLLVVFALIGLASESQARLSTGAFLAFNAALTQLLVASLAFSSAVTSFLSTIPIFEGVKPVLQTLPEVDPAKADPGTLTGEIEISHVTFRYQEHGPLVLNDISLYIRPGEFVAIVGPSGCGKSTLLRLLLRFETPCAGAIYYDGQDMDRLDVEAVRRQTGVVLQDGKLSADSILNNIIGASVLGVEDAWEAVRLVGLDKDIEQMPMGMYTVVSAGGGNLSGGQRQRLLIARAIVNKPRILFFDEATSALDNPNQAFVSASLERLSATRVVIAHRLSTIVNADRIYVLDEGRIIQSGSYADLIKQLGPFAELAKRQQA